jgi:hypothetical protein
MFRMGSLLSITGSDAAQRGMAPALNDRQRAYLQAIFDTDQTVEADMRAIPFSPFHDRPKASEWRWMEYSESVPEINKPASQLYRAIKAATKIDQGTGSTFQAPPTAA